MYNKVIEKTATMNIGEEFIFYIRDKKDDEIEFPICVKMIEEFQSTMVITGALGMSGFNMIFPCDDNLVDRDTVLKNMMHEDFSKEFEGYEFIKFHN